MAEDVVDLRGLFASLAAIETLAGVADDLDAQEEMTEGPGEEIQSPGGRQ
jgi:hypothetical protein